MLVLRLAHQLCPWVALILPAQLLTRGFQLEAEGFSTFRNFHHTALSLGCQRSREIVVIQPAIFSVWLTTVSRSTLWNAYCRETGMKKRRETSYSTFSNCCTWCVTGRNTLRGKCCSTFFRIHVLTGCCLWLSLWLTGETKYLIHPPRHGWLWHCRDSNLQSSDNWANVFLFHPSEARIHIFVLYYSVVDLVYINMLVNIL